MVLILYGQHNLISIFNLGEGKFGTDEEVFNKVFAHESIPQLRLIFEEYKNIGGRTIEQAIKKELSGELKDAILAIGNLKKL